MNVKIKFVKVPKPRSLAEGQSFKVGQVIDLPYASAQHWLTRNVAVAVVEDAVKVKPELAETDDPEKPAAMKRGRPPKAV